MNLIEKINKISEESRNQFKPDLKKYGKNFRAISESAVLDVLNPLFIKYNIAYEVLIEKTNLRVEKVASGRDVNGNIIETLVFVADAIVRLCFQEGEDNFIIEGWGSGVDFGDKATGKAITAAVKYALFKGLRLQYSDDPDAETSEEIQNIVQNMSKADLEKFIDRNKTFSEISKDIKKAAEKKEDPLATEAQLNYVKGLAVACGLSDEEFKAKYKYYPYDSNMPMRKARELIEELKKLQDAKLPF